MVVASREVVIFRATHPWRLHVLSMCHNCGHAVSPPVYGWISQKKSARAEFEDVQAFAKFSFSRCVSLLANNLLLCFRAHNCVTSRSLRPVMTVQRMIRRANLRPRMHISLTWSCITLNHIPHIFEWTATLLQVLFCSAVAEWVLGED